MTVGPDVATPAQASEPSFCPVCRAFRLRSFAHVDGRDYSRCDHCEATVLDSWQRLPIQEEHAQYLLHQNDPADPHYRRFLSKLANPLLKRLSHGRRGLDYGCGPGPAMAQMLSEVGHEMSNYDPLFHPDPSPLRATYDFITCTEVVEHFHHPAEEFDRLDGMLRPGGWLGITTCFQTEDARFANWHYRRDPTHVVFYREATLRRIAAQHHWVCEIPGKDIALMRKPERQSKPA